VIDRQAWLFSELAYQLGFETQIVYLRNPKTKVSPHTICEIRKDGKVWTVDPFTGTILKNTSVSDISDSIELKKKMWPSRPDWQTAANDPVFYTPSYPQAYASRNQILYNKLKPVLGDYCPRFGEPPLERQKKYLILVKNLKNNDIYNFWFFPFRLLHFEMVASENTSPKSN